MLAAAGYLVVIVAALWAVGAGRQWALATLDNPAARADWQTWQREETARQRSGEPTVARRLPRVAEPPLVVLVRDRYWLLVVAAIVFATLFYGFLLVTVRGAWRTGAATGTERGTGTGTGTGEKANP